MRGAAGESHRLNRTPCIAVIIINVGSLECKFTHQAAAINGDIEALQLAACCIAAHPNAINTESDRAVDGAAVVSSGHIPGLEQAHHIRGSRIECSGELGAVPNITEAPSIKRGHMRILCPA